MSEYLIEKCVYYEASRSQRKQERERDLGDDGTSGFEIMGCYECDGFNKDCKLHYVLEKVDHKTNEIYDRGGD